MLPEPFAALLDEARVLLDRPLSVEDGLPEVELRQAETRLGIFLPFALRLFYQHLGRVEMLTESFQRFASPQQLSLHQGRIVFLEEHQQVCYWSVDHAGSVFQIPDLGEAEAYPEPQPLECFLHTLLYYQLAQGGYPYCAQRYLPAAVTAEEQIRQLHPAAARPAVAVDGLRIWLGSGPILLWCLPDPEGFAPDGLFLSALHPQLFQQYCARWNFTDLSG
ncbi:hypothetical protein [Leeia aquatica]|uniref:Knr4/Smi1-like domain-containing protein n=1 Tax=Leeia aquatica TaxID=2725557 RepID=A0A847S4Y4_9NEIS|nr:hypothetical protein [Leeia aquatica]NLR76811.1 hypothetical protein [Leeia aquatica]